MLRVASILEESVVDGQGIRVVVFFQGCSHQCAGCHNPDLLPFDGGQEYTVQQLCEEILQHLTGLHRGVTFSGGDPLFQADELAELVQCLREQKPDLNLWLYTGFVYEKVKELPVISMLDVLVDGPFVEEQKDLLLKFRGSSNQRLVDVQASLQQGRTIELKI